MTKRYLRAFIGDKTETQRVWTTSSIAHNGPDETPWLLLLVWYFYGFPGGSAVKNLPAKQETRQMPVQFLGQEDPLEKGMATHSSSLAWEMPWTEESGELQSMGLQRVGHDWSN